MKLTIKNIFYFIQNSNVVVAANSQGVIKVGNLPSWVYDVTFNMQIDNLLLM